MIFNYWYKYCDKVLKSFLKLIVKPFEKFVHILLNFQNLMKILKKIKKIFYEILHNLLIKCISIIEKLINFAIYI